MGILYQASDPMVWAIWLFVVFALMAFNEFGRTSVWGGVALFVVAPIVFTIFVWPHTAAPGNEYGTGNWFNWAKTYSALAGCVGFMALRFVKWRGADGREHHLYEKRWELCFPPLILAINICEAVVRDIQMYTYGLWDGAVVDHVWMISGPWNIMNAIAGILNIITICGWFGIFISKDKSRDMIWPDMLWMWIIAYDLWNFAYTYNCMSDHSTYTGLALLIACTVPTFFTKRGAWLQHRAQTLALYAMFAMALPQFYTFAEIPTTHNPTAFFVVSLIAVKAVHWFDVPNHVLTIPSVIPMIPGVLMYRSLFAFINLHGVIGEVTNAFANGINSALIILCISLGVAVPNIFARRYIAKDRQRYLEEELEKRRQRGKFIEW